MNATTSQCRCIPYAVLNFEGQAKSRPLKRTAIRFLSGIEYWKFNHRPLSRSERLALAMLRADAKRRANRLKVT